MGMKILVIGDIHGRSTWKTLASDEYDLIVFMGDYFDTFEPIDGNRQINNFLDIMEYKKNNLDRVICLYGNHEHHYLDIGQRFSSVQRYSGYQADFAMRISEVLKENLKYIQMCYRYKHFLFTHAGVSYTWCKAYNIDIAPDKIEQSINDLFRYKPYSFNFQGSDPYGDDPTQSPIWIREYSMMIDGIQEYHHIVGHTEVRSIRTNLFVTFVDCLPNECLIIEDDQLYVLYAKVNQVVKLK